MKGFMMMKPAAEELGLPISLLRKWCKRMDCQKLFHKFDPGLTAPIYVDVDGLRKYIQDGKLDA